MRKRNRLALASSLFAGLALLGVTVRHLPSWLSALHSNALAFVILFIPVGLVLLIQRYDLAKRVEQWVEAPVDVRLEVWDRRLSEKREDRRDALVMGPETMRGVIETPEHIFLFSRNNTIILPATAFPDSKSKDAFAGHWEQIAV